MEENPPPLQVRPHLGAGLHALVLKPKLLHPNLTNNWWYSLIQDRLRIKNSRIRAPHPVQQFD
jgi:hypothetical protein